MIEESLKRTIAHHADDREALIKALSQSFAKDTLDRAILQNPATDIAAYALDMAKREMASKKHLSD